MTDLDLQDALIREIRELTDSHGLKKLDGEVWKDFNIYRQEKLYKDDESDEDQEDYLIVILDMEDTDEEGNWVVTVHFVMSIMLLEEEHQGNLILANLMNQLDMHFCKKGIIDSRYEMKRERHKRFNHECYPNYYECDYITKWEVPGVCMEGIGDLL